MVKHQKLHHPEEEAVFHFHLHKVWKTSLARQIGEALALSEVDHTRLMNSRSEWGTAPIPRVTILYPDSPEKNPGQNPNLQTNPSWNQNAHLTSSAGMKRRNAVTCPPPAGGRVRGPMDLFLAAQPMSFEARNENTDVNAVDGQAELEIRIIDKGHNEGNLELRANHFREGRAVLQEKEE